MKQRERIREASKNSEEIHDLTPVHIPGKPEKPLGLREEMRRFVREELSKVVQEKHDLGSFTEEDDFSEDNEELDMLTPYNVIPMTPVDPVDDLEGSSSPDEPVEENVPDTPSGETEVSAAGAATDSNEAMDIN